MVLPVGQVHIHQCHESLVVRRLQQMDQQPHFERDGTVDVKSLTS